MMTKDKTELNTALPAKQPSRTIPGASPKALAPAFILLLVVCLQFLPLGPQILVADISIFAWLELATAIAVAALYPLVWRQGYRRAVVDEQEDQQSSHSESHRQLQEARYQRDRRGQELNEALELVKEQNDRAKALSVDAKRNAALTRTAIDASAEALIITDANGVIQDISTPASNLCGIHRLDALDQPFDDIVKLFDPTAENPDLHPLRRVALQVIESSDNVPKLENALLRNRGGRSRPILLTSMAVTDKEGTVAGAYIKLELQDVEDGATSISSPQTPSAVDPSTGLQNRDAFRRRCDDLLRQARQHGQEHMLLFISPSNLDFIADRFGYRAAEQVLWQVAQACKEASQEARHCFHVAAGRFAILLPDVSREDALEIGETIREELNQASLSWDEQTLNLQSNIVALSIDATSPGITKLLDQAEAMLRSARRSGARGVYQGVPVPIPQDQRFSDAGWVEWLKQRLDAGLGHLLSQEIHSIQEGSSDKLVECFVRIEDNDGVWIAPSEYLPALQRTGDTGIIDLWMLGQLLKQFEEQPSLTHNYALFSLNVSAESISSQDFLERAVERLQAHPGMAQHICFEIQESTAVSLQKQTAMFTDAIHGAGAKFALDQCRGIHLPEVLRKRKPDLLKIDGSLVRRAGNDKLQEAQLRWVLESAKIGGIRTVACGIENSQRVQNLTEMGFDFAQGAAINKIGPIML